MKKPTFAVIECEHRKGLRTDNVTFSPDGQSIIGFLNDGGDHAGIAKWDADTGKVVETRSAERGTRKGAVEWIVSSDDRTRMAVRFEEKLTIMDTKSLKERAGMKGYFGALGWARDGKRIVTVYGDDVRVWETANGRSKAKRTFKRAKGADSLPFAGFADNGEEIIIGRYSGIFTWNIKSGEMTPRVKFRPRDGSYWEHGLSPNRQVMLSLSDRGALIQTDTFTWKTKTFAAVKNTIEHSLTFSPDGKLAATGTGQGTVFVWDVAQGRPWLKWKKPNYDGLGSLMFSPDGQRLACALDSRVFVLDFRPGAKSVEGPKTGLAGGMLQCIEMIGGDDLMDEGPDGEPLNPLPVKCEVCKMLDLDFVAEPYLLNRGISSPAELASTGTDNFLVRESAKKALETVAPGQCRFMPTIHYKTRQPTPWFLAVPQRTEITATPPAKRQRCPRCGEPWDFHPYSEADDVYAWQNPIAPHDVFRSRNWGSHKAPFKGWGKPRPQIFGRLLYFSVRLETLFKKLKLRGLVRYYECKEAPSGHDLTWVEEQLRVLKAGGARPKSAKAAAGVNEWFAEYLKNNARKTSANYDIAAVERARKLKLPDSYKRFIAKVGAKSFKDVDGEEGLTVRILPPQRLDFDQFRKTPLEEADEDEERIDGVIFATTDYGDDFCFDVEKKDRDYPVYKYNHEIDDFEPYTSNFAEAVKRFAGAE